VFLVDQWKKRNAKGKQKSIDMGKLGGLSTTINLVCLVGEKKSRETLQLTAKKGGETKTLGGLHRQGHPEPFSFFI